MLHQNWFMDKRFEMYEDYGESQSFYDTETKNIYVVFEERGACPNGSTVVQEITHESIEYQPNIKRYVEWKRKHNSGWKTNDNGDPYYVSPRTEKVYMFYDLVGKGTRKGTDIIICMLDYQSEKVMLETENLTYTDESEQPITQEIVGWQYCYDDEIPKEDMELMIEEYEERRIGK